MPPIEWRYRSAFLLGLLAGALAFLLQHFVQPFEFARQWHALFFFLVAGGLVGCVIAALRNRTAWKAYEGQEQRRGFDVLRRPPGD